MRKLDNMNELKITESSQRKKNVLYVYSSLKDILTQMDAKSELKSGKNRSELKVSFLETYKDLFLSEAEDKVADIIAINYKYNYFNKNIVAQGLKQTDKEILLCALISADMDEDKKYIVRKLKYFSEYCIDGIFNFRMKPLKEKWQEIVSYIPQTFTPSELKDFISYLIKDKQNKRVYVENFNVYDKYFNVLQKTKLLDGDSAELNIVKEIILSGAGEVELANGLDEEVENYVKEFYGDRVYFADGYFKDH